MKKIVGLSSTQTMLNGMKFSSLKQLYTEAIEKAGGISFIIPFLSDPDNAKDIIFAVDILVLTGGLDIHPLLYNEEPHNELQETDQNRDYIEKALLEAADKKGIPIFGICRGMQMINCFYGGNLHQDISTEIKNSIGHFAPYSASTFHHTIDIEKGGFLDNIYNTEKLSVNSVHHQSIKDLAKGFKIAARAKDGVVEAIENKEKKIYAVQFHPEAMMENNPMFSEIFKFILNL